MPSQKPSLRKRLNKKKKRRFGPLRGKCREYVELPGVKLALFIAFEKVDRNNKTRKEFYSLRSKRNIPWLRNIDGIVSSPLYVTVTLAKLVQLSDDLNKNELLDKMGSDIKIPCKEREDNIERGKKNTLVTGSQYLDLLGSTRNGPVFPPLSKLNLDLIYDILSF